MTVPCVGAVLPVTVRPTPTSLLSTDAPFSVVLAGVVARSLLDRAPTVMVTVAVDV